MSRNAWRQLKTGALVAVVAAAALVPLYGDPRQSPVTHAEWGRMLLRALELDEMLPPGSQASAVFSILSWKNSLAYRGDRYAWADGVEVVGEGITRRVQATAEAAEVRYPLAVVRAGDYKVRVRTQGSPESPAAVELRRVGEAAPTASFRIVPASVSGWVEGGSTHLDPGGYEASVLLPRGTDLEWLEVAPPCLAAIEPPGGWRGTAVALTTDVAVTMVKALNAESELPPAATPIEVSGGSFQVTSATLSVASASTVEEMWLRAGPQGLEAVAFADLPEAGLYTLSVFGSETGTQSWLFDSCQKAVLCGALNAGKGARWRTLLTAEFTAGRHFFTVKLAAGAVVERLRVERRKDTPADYLATIRRLGFDPGPDGPITRDKAIDAMRFLQGRRKEVLGGPCGDVPPPTTTVASGTGGPGGLAEPVGSIQGPGVAPPPTGTGEPPLAPPVIPPQQPASPVVP
jgi:hypothetical protein